jgi:iron(II)-dependent oxidoreductase
VAAPEPVAAVPGEVLVEAGPFVMGVNGVNGANGLSGTAGEPWSYDNERPAHDVDLPAYWIDAAPVTNAEYAAFVDAGGYDDPVWWDAKGWAWRLEADLRHPQFWERGGGSWQRTRFGWHEVLAAAEPVQHVCWYEADAYARWAGKRLPTEAEWEKAALWDPAAGRSRPWPWGEGPPDETRANLDQLGCGPAPVGAYPAGASAYGVEQLVGDCWEWTRSDFLGYPGFVAYPYDDYSKSWFGSDYKVLRGASWATRPSVARGTFRNWDYPIRRQIFAGFRCARDAEVRRIG